MPIMWQSGSNSVDTDTSAFVYIIFTELCQRRDDEKMTTMTLDDLLGQTKIVLSNSSRTPCDEFALLTTSEIERWKLMNNYNYYKIFSKMKFLNTLCYVTC